MGPGPQTLRPQPGGERSKRIECLHGNLSGRQDVLVLRPSCEMRTDPNEGFQVDALSAQTGAFAVPSAKCALGDDDGFRFVHSVNLDQNERNVCKRSAGEHGLHSPVTCRKLPPPPRSQQPGTLFQQERTALLVVNPARGPRSKERR